MIGLLFGIFDPPHNGHLNLISEALGSGQVDKVLLVPVENKDSITPLETRIFMCDLLTTLYPPGKLKVSRSGLTKNIDLLYSEIGGDPITLIKTNEPNPNLSFSTKKTIEQLCKSYDGRFPLTISYPMFEISGDSNGPKIYVKVSGYEIRKMIQSGRDCPEFLPTIIFEFIKDNNLYK